jgi:hypothetical protein
MLHREGVSGSGVWLHAFLIWALDEGEWTVCPLGKSSQCLMGRRVGGLQNRFGLGGDKQNLCPCQESYLSRQARGIATMQTE